MKLRCASRLKLLAFLRMTRLIRKSVGDQKQKEVGQRVNNKFNFQSNHIPG